MRTSKFQTGGAAMMQNPKNHIYNQMQAVENFHLVKRVMSVKKSLQNQPPANYSHLNLGRFAKNSKQKLQFPRKSTQEHCKELEQYKQNQNLLRKMLKIMDRPRITTVTSFKKEQKNGQNLNLFLNRSFSSQNSARSQKKKRSRSPSVGRLTPTSGKGPSSLNLSSRQLQQKEIQTQNFRLVDSLCNAKPIVPVFEDLRVWQQKQKTLRNQIGTVRYGALQPKNGMNLRMSLNESFGNSNQRLSLRKVTPNYIKLVAKNNRPNTTQNSKIQLDDLKRSNECFNLKTSQENFEAVYPNAINIDQNPSRYGNRPSKARIQNVFDISSSILEKPSNSGSSQKFKNASFEASPIDTADIVRQRNQSINISSVQTKPRKSNRMIQFKARPKTSHQLKNLHPQNGKEATLETANTIQKVQDTEGDMTEVSEDGKKIESNLPNQVRPSRTADGFNNPRQNLVQVKIRGQSGPQKNVSRIHNKFVSKRDKRNFELKHESYIRNYAATGVTTYAPSVLSQRVDFQPNHEDDPYGAAL